MFGTTFAKNTSDGCFWSLKLSGDAEVNPGPYEIIISVQVNFNQGNVTLFGETADSQSACNA